MVSHRLREAFDEDHPRDDGAIGEMTQEERLVGLEGPDSQDSIVAELR